MGSPKIHKKRERDRQGKHLTLVELCSFLFTEATSYVSTDTVHKITPNPGKETKRIRVLTHTHTHTQTDSQRDRHTRKRRKKER